MIPELLFLLIEAALTGSFQDAETLIERFRSESAQERDEAAQALKKMGETALPALERAAKDADTEVASRSRHLLRWLDAHATIPPGVQASFSGIEERIAAGDAHEWTAVFFEAKRLRPTIRGLRELSPGAWAILAVRALANGAVEERQKVCDAIGDMDLRDAMPAVLPLLGAPEEDLRCAALWAVEGVRGVETIPTLLPLLKDKSASVRVAAAKVLASLGNRSGIPILAELLESRTFLIQLEVTNALIDTDGREALETIRRISTEAFDGNARKAAAEALCGMARLSEIPDLLRILNDDNEEIRGRAAWALRRLDPPAELLPMERLLETDTRALRTLLSAAKAGVLWKGQGPRLVALLTSKDPALLIPAVSLLGDLGGPEAAPALLPLAAHENASLRQATIIALGRLGDRSASKTIAGRLTDTDRWVRREALRSLARLGSKEQAPDIAKRLADEEPWIRGQAAMALSDLGLREELPKIQALLKDPDEVVRQDVRRAVAHLRRQEAIPDLLLGLQSRSPAERIQAVQLLSEIGAASSVKSLLVLLKDPEESVREAAVSALAWLGAGQDAIELALTLLDHPDPSIRACACRALGAWGDRRAIAALLPLLRDEHARVSVSAAKALCRLGATQGVELLLQEAGIGGRDSLIELNALRYPETWRRIAGLRPAVVLEGTQESLLGEAARIAGMALEGREVCFRGVSTWMPVFGASEGRAAVELLQFLEFGRSHNLELVFEPDRIRILKRAEGIRFWQEWWKSTRK